MSQYFPKPFEPFGKNIKVELDLSSNAIKVELKNTTGIDTSKVAAKSDLASLNAGIDKFLLTKAN